LSIDNVLIKERLKEEARKRLARNNYLDYYKYINRYNKKFRVGKHIEYVCNILDKFYEGEIKKLALFMPPQHGKSQMVTEAFASYYVMKKKDKKVMIASYGDKTANKFGKENLDKVHLYGKDLFDVELDKSNRSKTDWSLSNERGSLLSTTIRGGATSFSADLLIIDDPVKGPSDLTKLKRDEVHDMYQRVFKTRLSADGQEIMILTRWHEDDLAGRVVSEENGWTIINIPCIAEDEDDVLDRLVGELLFPEIGKDKEWAELERIDVGERAWNSMYQQRPTFADGNVIERHWIKYYTRLPDVIDEYTMTWDLILKGTETSDYVVGQVWARSGADHYLTDMVRGQFIYAVTLSVFDSFVEKHPEVNRILIENKMNGTNLIVARKSLVSGIIEINPTLNKDVRVAEVSPIFESGNVYLPTGASFTEILVDEALSYPSGKYDDAIDACAQYLKDYKERITNRRTKTRRSTGPVRMGRK
jgi:predicted phage terminase large subunit-like protein